MTGNLGYLIIIGIALSSPSRSWASNIWDHFRDEAWKVRTNRAYEEILQNKEIRGILKDNDEQSLKKLEKILGPSKIETTKFQHYYKGVEVLGSMAIHHSTEDGIFIRNRLSQFDLDVKPTVSINEAVSIARAYAGEFELKSTPTLRILPNHSEQSANLIYWIEIEGKGMKRGSKDLLINAHTGKVIASLPQEYTLTPIQVYSAKNTGVKTVPHILSNAGVERLKDCDLVNLGDKSTETISAESCKEIYQGSSQREKGKCQIIDGLDGLPLALDAQSCNQVVTNSKINESSNQTDPAVARANENSRKVLEFYENHFNRKSFDNQGSDLVSVIHAGESMSNAIWMVKLNTMVYGDGDGKDLGDFTSAVDVAGHEMTHGVTSNTAKLIMMGESGALNEAFSDFFGKLIEAKDSWVVGEGLFTNSNGPKGIRNLATPSALTGKLRDSEGNIIRKAYPAKKSEVAQNETDQPCDSSNDVCWVHYNSTVPSHASYLVYKALGAQKAELLYYTTLTQNLTETEDFESAAQATVDTCHQLRFAESDCDQVKNTYAELGFSPH